ncbi:MAG: hypothetical protein LBS11_01410 [Oscillospiraceae bacterium]|jgi:hypothetical protein|nr:hypothetical protein [Oscillospiraceae bacterium]
MKIYVQATLKPNLHFDIDNATPIASGGEGDVFQISTDCLVDTTVSNPLVKVYYPVENKIAYRQRKGLALVDKYISFLDDFSQQTNFSASQYAFTVNTAVDVTSKEYVGFSMNDLGRYSTLDNFQYKNGKIVDVLTDYEISDVEAVNLIYNLTYGVFLLHKHNIVLGDLNERNILYDTNRMLPLFLDIDSAQVDDYTSLVMHLRKKYRLP